MMRFGLCILVALVVGCQGSDECKCMPSGVGVVVSHARAPHVSGVHVSGPACQVTGSDCGPGTRLCVIDGVAEGPCHIEVEFNDGTPTFGTDVTLVKGGSADCCGGFYVTGDEFFVRVPELSSDGGPD